MKIDAKKRDLKGKQVKSLRNEGMVPAALYGPSNPSMDITVDLKAFKKLFNNVGQNKFFDLVIDDSEPIKALIKEVQVHPIKDSVLSVSFYRIDDKRKITVDVPIDFEGVAPAVQQNLGFLVHQMETIKLHCYPKDLPSSIKIDISTLANPGDSITVSQIELKEGVEFDSAIDLTSALIYVGSDQLEEPDEPTATEGAEEGVEGATAATTEGTEEAAKE